MTDEQLRALLVELRQKHETCEDAARELYRLADRDGLLRLALCRYVIDRMVPMKGTVG